MNTTEGGDEGDLVMFLFGGGIILDGIISRGRGSMYNIMD